LEKKRKIEGKELGRENRAANFQGSPAKKTRQNNEKPPSSRSEKKELQERNQLVSDCSKESQTLANKARKIADGLNTVKPALGPHGDEYKTVFFERKSPNQEFGFKVRGGTFYQPAVTVAQVAKDSLADRQGLKTGDRIIRVNDQLCGRGRLDIAQVIGIIKAAAKIHMRIVSGGFPSKDECKVHGKRNKSIGEADGAEQKRLSSVCVYPNEGGWLGCCIRGGTDYACDVHVISVDSCSPAERAGVKAGDVIVEVNGASTKDLTHVQVVRLVITSGPCVTFSLKSGSRQRRCSSRRQPIRVRPTPLRTQQRGSQDVTPPGRPSFTQFDLPGYPLKQHGAVVDSPSQLPMDVMRLDCMPPPPYTPEVPSRHRLLAKGWKGQGPQESPYQEESQDNHHQQEQQGDPNGKEARDIPNQEEQVDSTSQQELQESHHQLGPQNTTYQQQIQDNPYQEELQGCHCQEVTMEVMDERQSSNTTLYLLDPATGISDGNKANFEKKMPDAFQHGKIIEQEYIPNPVINAMQLEQKTSSEEREPVINETTRDTSTLLDPAVGNNDLSSTIKSPAASNGGESFLSQIRQFNKEKLKKLATWSSEKCQSISSGCYYTSDELKWKEGGKDSIKYNGKQENIDATNLLSVLNRVMKNRARALHDTLSSADEDESSNDDDDDDEWEL